MRKLTEQSSDGTGPGDSSPISTAHIHGTSDEGAAVRGIELRWQMLFPRKWIQRVLQCTQAKSENTLHSKSETNR